ncbi:unnamed protein product [Tuber aestivum]|uniref:Uncharacterized protein n=1 Tax=Tuber aestivum TaxID=59557 RepID=A0A292Q485_9PEZI|nr:unnamed protein product [Tuber aestivum]
MSISSGRSPRSVFSNNRSDISPRKGPICIKCQKPAYPRLDLIVRCGRCFGNHHISCCNSTVSVNREVICQRCAAHPAEPGNGHRRESVSPTRSRPRKIPRLSPNASDTSAGRSSSLSKGSTRMTFSPADLQEEGTARDRNDHSRNPKSQRSVRRVLDSHSIRVSESLGNGKAAPQWGSLVTTAASRDREDNFARRAGDGIGPAYPTDIGSQRTPHHNSHDDPGEFDAGTERRFDVPELAYYSDGMSRSANVFPGSRKLAVVIDNRSRSGSVSTNGCQGEGWNRTPPAVKDPQDDVTPIPHSKLRQTLNSPTPGEFSQPSADQHLFLDGADESGALRRRRLKRPFPVSEVPDSEEERERVLTGGLMSLEPLEGYSDGRNSRQPANGYQSLPSESPEQQIQDRTAGGSRHERLQRQFNWNNPSNAHSSEESPYSRPSSSSCRGKGAVERPTTGRTGISSPHYSPPPPWPGANDTLSRHHTQFRRLARRPQMAQVRGSSVDSVVSCRRCGSDMAILDDKRANICSSCVRREHCRGSDLTDTMPREPCHDTIPSYRSPAPSCLRLRTNRKNDLRSRHSSTLSATGLLDNRSNTTPSSDSLPSDISRGCTPQDLQPVEVFRTAKQRVIERYQMKFPKVTNGGLPSQPIEETAIRNQKARKIMDVPKPKVSAAAEKLGTAAPLKKNGVNGAILVRASARVDARKPINGSTLPGALSTTEPPKHDTRMTVAKGVFQLKKPARKGPAIKYAGGGISRVLVTDDSSSESGHAGKLRVLEKRLQDQKGYTKNQAEKAAKLQVKLQESEKEKAALQEKLKIFLTGIHGPNEKPTPGNEIPEPEVIAESLPTQGSSKQEPPKKKVLKRLVRWEEAHSDRSTPQEDTQAEHGAQDGRADTAKKTFTYGPMRDFYSGNKFCGVDPWGYPTTTEQPGPDPSTFRKRGWRKTVYRPFDQARLMKVHLHRLISQNRPPLTMTVAENPPDDDDESASTSNTPIADKIDKPETEHGSTEVPSVISFDEFMGLPESMVPSVKDGCLGFRSGVINPRTGRLERNVPHHRIRAPGDLKPT